MNKDQERTLMKSWLAPTFGLIALALAAAPAAAQENNVIKGMEEAEPPPLAAGDWPCVQGKIENLSVAQVWDGPSVEGLKGWDADPDMAALLKTLVTRRHSIEDAEAAIKKYADSLPPDKRDERLTLLFAGLFDKMNIDRRTVVNGIHRYQKSQVERAAELSKEENQIAELEIKAKTDDKLQAALNDAQDKFTWATRIFQDRQSNIPIACELPQLIEERLYALAHAIRAEMKS